jgi:hypothetical protein
MRKSLKKLSFAILAVLCLLVSWVMFGTNVAISQQIADPNFDAKVAYPAYLDNFSVLPPLNDKCRSKVTLTLINL